MNKETLALILIMGVAGAVILAFVGWDALKWLRRQKKDLKEKLDKLLSVLRNKALREEGEYRIWRNI